jgi:hypothetical protein
MLRGVGGDELFFEAIKNYASDEDFIYQNATTEDLQEVFETTFDLNLDFYFDQWIYDEFYPIYNYNFEQTSNTLHVTIYQAQNEMNGWRTVFEMPIQVLVNFTDDTDTLFTVWNDQQLQQFDFNISKEVYSVLIDPDEWILRKVYFNNDLPVGVDENGENKSVAVYPNPANTSVHIKINVAHYLQVDFALYDASGRKILVQTITKDLTIIPLSKIPRGLYFYEITGKNIKKPINGKMLIN